MILRQTVPKFQQFQLHRPQLHARRPAEFFDQVCAYRGKKDKLTSYYEQGSCALQSAGMSEFSSAKLAHNLTCC